MSKLTIIISRVLQKLLLKYFNGTAAFAFIIPAVLVLFKNLDLNSNDLQPVIKFLGSSLQNWYKLPDGFEYLAQFYYIIHLLLLQQQFFPSKIMYRSL